VLLWLHWGAIRSSGHESCWLGCAVLLCRQLARVTCLALHLCLRLSSSCCGNESALLRSQAHLLLLLLLPLLFLLLQHHCILLVVLLLRWML
jgi:hypothetical protein